MSALTVQLSGGREHARKLFGQDVELLPYDVNSLQNMESITILGHEQHAKAE